MRWKPSFNRPRARKAKSIPDRSGPGFDPGGGRAEQSQCGERGREEVSNRRDALKAGTVAAKEWSSRRSFPISNGQSLFAPPQLAAHAEGFSNNSHIRPERHPEFLTSRGKRRGEWWQSRRYLCSVAPPDSAPRRPGNFFA